tara:strand:+ start:10942 stop:11691 length:750 start_codon:yes stop_codon:yes gene_type:complete
MRVALITGASSGIGLATAKKLACFGFNLILCGRNEKNLLDLKNSLSKLTRVICLVFDVRNKNDVFKKIGSLDKEWRDVDVLINNAGNAHGKDLLVDDDVENWEVMIDGNVKGLLYVSKAVIPRMVEKECGHIINISSVAGKETYEGGVVYCASKKSVESISEGMRIELTKHNIKVSNIAPGAVETNFSKTRFKGDVKKSSDVYLGYEPLVADDVADLISYIVNCPERVNIADVTIFPKSQSSATVIHKS